MFLHQNDIIFLMRYGDRLKEAMEYKASLLHRKVTNTELAQHAGVSKQNIGLIINGTQGGDQRLNQESHFKAAAWLKVSPTWLATGEGDMLKGVQPELQPLSTELQGLMAILNAIPEHKRKAALFDATMALAPHLPTSTQPAAPESGNTELPLASALPAKASAVPHR